MDLQGAPMGGARPGRVSSVVSALSVRKPEVQIPRLAPLARDDGEVQIPRLAPLARDDREVQIPRLAPLARDDREVQIPRLAPLARDESGLAPLARDDSGLAPLARDDGAWLAAPTREDSMDLAPEFGDGEWGSGVARLGRG